MKPFLKSLIPLAAIALLASCAKEEDKRLPIEEGLVPATFSINLDGAAATKAFSDGTSANALLVGVYNQQGEGTSASYTYLPDLSVTTLTGEKAVAVSGKAATFKTTLVRGQKYALVFWAQNSSSSAYTVDFAGKDLSVSNAGDANDETRDAFYKVYETGVISETNKDFTGIELKRPFAQINVLAPNEDVVAAAKSKVLLSKTSMVVDNVPAKMELLKGTVSDAAADLKTFTFSASAITEQPFDDYSSTHTYIAMNYVLAGAEKSLYNVHLDVGSTVNAVEQSPIHFDINSVPAQRNYRTNIIGNVFTLDASFNIIIAPEYQAPDWDKLLDGGVFEPTTITPTISSTLPAGVGITAGTGSEPSTITFAAGSTNPLTISASASSEAQIKAQSSNAAVATAAVSGSNVTITPVGPGEATVTIFTDPVLATKAIDETKNYAAGKLEYKIVVEAPAEKKDVSIVCQDVNLKVGGGWELEPEVTPEELYTEIVATPAEGYSTYFDWDADNWIIEAKKETPEGGIAITLSYPGNEEYKEASTTIHVIISEKEVPEIAFEDFSVKVNESKAIEYLIDPENLAVTFEAEKDQEVYELVKVGEKDAVKGLKGGSATLTLKLAETETTAATSKTVTVTVNKLAATVTASDFELTAGDIKTLVAGEDFNTESDGVVSLSVDSEYAEYLTVEPGTLKIKALKEGEAMFSINVAESDKYLAAEPEVVVVTIAAAPVQEPETATITITGVPTEAVEPGATFDITVTTNSTAPVVVEPTAGAGINQKSGNIFTVTASDSLTEDTEVTITASVAAVENAFTAAQTTAKFTVKKKEDVVPPTSSEYVKITSTADVTDGDYLIVYEGESAVAFNGSLETLDAVGNTIAVTIASGKIAGTEAIDAAVFTLGVIDGGFSIQSASGKYIGRTTTGNGLNANDTAILNTIEVTDGVAAITSNGLVLKYNKASNQTRFRYYGSGQEDIAIYKKVGSGSGATPTQKEDPTLTINGTIPTDAMAKDATFDFSVATNSTGAISVALSPEGAATVAAKANAEKTWTVTAGEPSAETTVTLTVSVAATDTYKAKSATATFKVAKKAGSGEPEAGTAEKPYTVAEAIAVIDAGAPTTEVYVTGVVKSVGQINTQYKSITYNIKDADVDNDFQIYSGKGLDGADVVGISPVAVGDVVVVKGVIKKYNSTYEMDKNNVLVSIVPDTTPKFGASINGETIAAAGGTKTVTITGNVAWTATVTGGATLSADSGEGASTITVTIPANTSETAEPEYTVTVSTSADVETKSYSFTVKQSKYVAPSGDETTVEFTYSTEDGITTEAGEQTGVLEGVSIVISNGVKNTANTDIRVYKDATLTVTAPGNANITKIEFTCSSGNGTAGFADLDGFTKDDPNGVWAGSANSVVFTASGKQVRIKSLKVTYN